MTFCAIHADIETADGIHLCHTCMTSLERDLEAVPDVWDDLRVTMAKLDKGAPGIGGSTWGPAAPVNLSALDAGTELTRILAEWGAAITGRMPTSDAPGHAKHLLGLSGTIRRHEASGEFIQELHQGLSRCRAITDRATEMVTLGVCGALQDDDTECAGTLVAPKGGRMAFCKTCGASMEVAERIRWMVSEAWHFRLPLPGAIRALELAGIRIKLKTARHWVSTGKLRGELGPDGAWLFSPAAVKATADYSRQKSLLKI